MAQVRRTDVDLVRISATITKENRQWLEDQAETRGVSMSALLDTLLTICQRKTKL